MLIANALSITWIVLANGRDSPFSGDFSYTGFVITCPLGSPTLGSAWAHSGSEPLVDGAA